VSPNSEGELLTLIGGDLSVGVVGVVVVPRMVAPMLAAVVAEVVAAVVAAVVITGGVCCPWCCAGVSPLLWTRD